MRIAVMADIHLGKFWKSNNSMSGRAEKVLRYFTKALEREVGYGSHLIIAGDIYDTVHPNVEMLVRFKSALDGILRKFKSVVVIAGNHETFIDRQGEQKSLLDLGVFYNDYAVTHTGWATSTYSDINTVFVPFQNDFAKAMVDAGNEHLSSDKINIIIAHETPKEVFSYSKFEMAQILQQYADNGKRVDAVILGHYHKPKCVTIDGVPIVSIGNSYYTTIDDVRDTEKVDLAKRYIAIISDDEQLRNGEVELLSIGAYRMVSVPYTLPTVHSLWVESQDEFVKVMESMRETHNSDPDAIFWLRSNVLLDYSQASYEGMDVYFDFVEDAESSVLTLDEIGPDTIAANSDMGKTIEERWFKYIESVDPMIGRRASDLACFLFWKRDDADITVDSIMQFLEGESK